jgi:hypothetical protein
MRIGGAALAIAVAITLGISIGIAPMAYCATLVLTYLLADRFLSAKLLSYLAAIAWLIALSDYILTMDRLPLPRLAELPRWIEALMRLLFAILGVFWIAGTLSLGYVANYLGAEVQNAVWLGGYLRSGAVFVVWGGIAVVLTATAWLKSRRQPEHRTEGVAAGIQDTQINRPKVDVWLLITCGLISVILAAIQLPGGFGMLMLALAAVNFLHAWRLSRRLGSNLQAQHVSQHDPPSPTTHESAASRDPS